VDVPPGSLQGVSREECIDVGAVGYMQLRCDESLDITHTFWSLPIPGMPSWPQRGIARGAQCPHAHQIDAQELPGLWKSYVARNPSARSARGLMPLRWAGRNTVSGVKLPSRWCIGARPSERRYEGSRCYVALGHRIRLGDCVIDIATNHVTRSTTPYRHYKNPRLF